MECRRRAPVRRSPWRARRRASRCGRVARTKRPPPPETGTDRRRRNARVVGGRASTNRGRGGLRIGVDRLRATRVPSRPSRRRCRCRGGVRSSATWTRARGCSARRSRGRPASGAYSSAPQRVVGPEGPKRRAPGDRRLVIEESGGIGRARRSEVAPRGKREPAARVGTARAPHARLCVCTRACESRARGEEEGSAPWSYGGHERAQRVPLAKIFSVFFFVLFI